MWEHTCWDNISIGTKTQRFCIVLTHVQELLEGLAGEWAYEITQHQGTVTCSKSCTSPATYSLDSMLPFLTGHRVYSSTLLKIFWVLVVCFLNKSRAYWVLEVLSYVLKYPCRSVPATYISEAVSKWLSFFRKPFHPGIGPVLWHATAHADSTPARSLLSPRHPWGKGLTVGKPGVPL